MTRALFLGILIALLFAAIVVASGPPTELVRQPQSDFLYMNNYRAAFQTEIDLQARVGTTVNQLHTFSFACTGVYSTPLSIAWDDPHFALMSYTSVLYCDEGWNHGAAFSLTPTEPGIVTAHVTFTTDIEVATATLIGNGVLVEPAEYWIADLPEETSAIRLLYDEGRDLIYLTDFGDPVHNTGLYRVIVFSPETRQTLATIPVGHEPHGLSMTPDGHYLLVANSGEQSVSVIDLDAWEEVRRIPLPSLGPFPDYTPYNIAAASNTLALIGGAPPGFASGAEIYELNLEIGEVAPRSDIGQGAHPEIRTSHDGSTTGILLEPYSSPSWFSRYDTLSDTAIMTSCGSIIRSLAISEDGTRMVSVAVYGGDPNLTLYDEALHRIRSIPLVEVPSLSAAFFPRGQKYVYAVNDFLFMSEADVENGVQVRSLRYELPPGHYVTQNAIAMSESGWLYVILNRSNLIPTSKLMALRVEPVDTTPPTSAVDPLPPEQTHNWWLVSWSGTDDLGIIERYTVQYRAGATGVWTDWLSTSGTLGLFRDATPGQTYYFRSQAVDLTGNVEPYPSIADTFTTAGADPTGLYHSFLPLASKLYSHP